MPCKSPVGNPVCCVAMDEANRQVRGIGYGMEDYKEAAHIRSHSEFNLCSISKKYESSPHELREISVAETIGKIGARELQTSKAHVRSGAVHKGTKLPVEIHTRRLEALLSHVTSAESVANATSWLDRVKSHMKSEHVPAEDEADKEFLSRFIVTKTCDGKVVDEWNEWIEPLTVTARHPFGFADCKPYANSAKFSESSAPKERRSNVDYVLLQSGKDLGKQEEFKKKNIESPRKHFLFDAGTSTFDSSLYWFTCAYSQRRVAFNDVYGWEMTILNPVEYWEKVPPKWIPHWHFYNTPVSGNPVKSSSPVRIIKSIADEDDFVAFKLDIDHPDTENPIAMDLLKDLSFSSLIDEFFFELHFQCEVMTECGWGDNIPDKLHGFQLQRAEVLNYFKNLREQGVRAHIWP